MAWQGHSLGFVGTGAAMSITFLGSAFAGGSSTLVGLDNVAVTAVPEPAALVLALAGIGIVGLARQRGRERAEGESALRGA
jgi:hypothetical protein